MEIFPVVVAGSGLLPAVITGDFSSNPKQLKRLMATANYNGLRIVAFNTTGPRAQLPEEFGIPAEYGDLAACCRKYEARAVGLKEENDMTCPFRNELLKKCDIYEVRPQI